MAMRFHALIGRSPLREIGAAARGLQTCRIRHERGYPHRHHLSAKVRMFIDLLAQHSANHQRLMNPNV
jgi:hypothetical protein